MALERLRTERAVFQLGLSHLLTARPRVSQRTFQAWLSHLWNEWNIPSSHFLVCHWSICPVLDDTKMSWHLEVFVVASLLPKERATEVSLPHRNSLLSSLETNLEAGWCVTEKCSSKLPEHFITPPISERCGKGEDEMRTQESHISLSALNNNYNDFWRKQKKMSSAAVHAMVLNSLP